MASPTDAIAGLLATVRGERPASMECSEAERALNVAMALAVELVVANDRIDRLERLVAELRQEPVEDLKAVVYDGAIAAERREANDAMLMRALRIFLDPRLAQQGDRS
jgi:hypothetical protein